MKKVLVGLVLLPVILVFAMRSLRGTTMGIKTIHHDIVRSRNLFTEMYGARVGGQIILFDAGIDGQGRALDRLLRELKGSRDDVSDVFLSHGHFDHVAASPLCPKAHIRVGQADVDLLAHRVEHEPAAARWFSRVLPVGPITATDPLPGRVEIPVGDSGRSVTAVPVPGHTPGSYLYFFDGVLFAGDSLQIDGDKLEFAMGAFSMDLDSNKRSIGALKSQISGLSIAVVCTGHQGCTPEGRGAAMLDELIARARPN